ncbi:MAG: hypothetical protein M3177_08880 [Pseudomonadota bacterium]|nr:hypothetical protein [Pseudomonadota bacterium]
MAEPSSRFPRAGGALLAGSILCGVLMGAFAGETSIGFLGGLALGLVLLGAVWLLDRR